MEILKNGENTEKKKAVYVLKIWFVFSLDVIVQMLEGSWTVRLYSVLSFYPMCSLPIPPSLAPFVWGDSDSCLWGIVRFIFIFKVFNSGVCGT